MKHIFLVLQVILVMLTAISTVTANDIDGSKDYQAIFDQIDAAENLFKDADLVTVFDRIVTEYADSGAAVTEEEILLHFRNGELSADYRSLHYDFNPRTAKIEFLEVTVFRAKDHVVERIPMEDMFVKKAPAQSIFWNFDVVTCPVPRLNDGDALYYKIKRQGLNLAYLSEITDDDFKFIPPQEGYFMDTLYFQDHHPVIEKIYDISGPREKPLQFTMANGSINTTVRFTEAEWQYTFSAKNIAAWKHEPFDDGYAETALKLSLASHPSWEMKSKWAYEHNEPQFIISDELRQKTLDIIEGCPDDLCKMNRLLHWVAEEIRYLGLDMGEGEGHMVHRTDQIFEERAGVCKDKAAILVSMLRAAGFESYFVMTLAMEQTLDIPADDKFNHGVVVIRNDDGSWTFLDPTWAPQNRPLFNYQEQEQPVLIAAPEGVDLMHIPYSPPEESPFIVNASTSLNLDGSAEIVMFIQTDGFVDGRFRSALNWMDKEYRDRFFRSFIDDLSQQAELIHYEFSHPLDFEQPLQMKIRANIPDAATIIGDKMYLNPLLTRHLWNARWSSRYLHAASGPEKRNHGLELQCTRHVVFHETITLPKGFILSETPEKIEIKGDTIDGSFLVHKSSGRKITIDQTINVKRRVTPANEYKPVRDAVNKLNEIRDTLLIFESDGKSRKNPPAPKVKGNVKKYQKKLIEDGAIIHDRTYTVIFEENKMTELFHQESTIYNEDGRDSIADNSYICNSEAQTIEFLENYSVTPDGKRIDVPEEALNITMDDSVFGAPSFNYLANYTVSQTGVEYGSTLVSSVKRTTNLKSSDARTNLQALFIPVQNFPVEKTSFIVQVKADQDIFFETLRMDMKPVISTEDSWKIYTWNFSDVDTYEYEYNSGSYYNNVPIILVSSTQLKNWESQIAELRSMVFPDTDISDAITENVTEINDGLLTGRDKIQALWNFVNTNISNVNISSRRFLYRTRTPAQIAASGYGYSIERLLLLSTLVEAAGGTCRIGFASEADLIPDSVPFIRLMNSNYIEMILDGDSEIVSLDKFGISTDSFPGKKILWIDRKGYNWQNPPSMSLLSDKVISVIDFEITEDNGIKGTMDISWAGVWNTGLEARNNTDKWILRCLPAYIEKAKISDLNILALNTSGGETRIQCNFAGNFHLTDFANGIKMLELGSCAHGITSDSYNVSRADKRKKPLLLTRCGLQKETVNIKFPESWKLVKTPSSQNIQTEFLTLQSNAKVEKTNLLFTRTIKFPVKKIPASEFASFANGWKLLTSSNETTCYFDFAEKQK